MELPLNSVIKKQIASFYLVFTFAKSIFNGIPLYFALTSPDRTLNVANWEKVINDCLDKGKLYETKYQSPPYTYKTEYTKSLSTVLITVILDAVDDSFARGGSTLKHSRHCGRHWNFSRRVFKLFSTRLGHFCKRKGHPTSVGSYHLSARPPFDVCIKVK